MFMHSWNKKLLLGVGLIIVQAIIYAVISKRSTNFSLVTFFICSLPGLIGILLIWIEKSRGRY